MYIYIYIEIREKGPYQEGRNAQRQQSQKDGHGMGLFGEMKGKRENLGWVGEWTRLQELTHVDCCFAGIAGQQYTARTVTHAFCVVVICIHGLIQGGCIHHNPGLLLSQQRQKVFGGQKGSHDIRHEDMHVFPAGPASSGNAKFEDSMSAAAVA